MKNNVALFSRLFIACQNQEGNLDEFFSNENQAFLPSITHNARLRSGNKSELLKYFEKSCPGCTKTDICEGNTDMIIIDGSAFIHAVRPEYHLYIHTSIKR